jgi:hypothetical protein
MSEPVLITTDDDGVTYLHDHLTHFFNTTSYDIIKSLSQTDKERYFKLVTDHKNVMAELYGNSVLNSKIALPAQLKNGVDDQLIQEYKAWLDKQ